MQCQECSHRNDDDAAFCANCGSPVDTAPAAAPTRRRKAYLSVLFLIAVLIVLIGVAFYKFVLPDGVVTVVNGEEIRRSELDAAVDRNRRAYETAYGAAFFEGAAGAERMAKMRYSTLNDLIRERIALQEAHDEGIRVSEEDIAVALADMRKAGGMDAGGGKTYLQAHYGTEEALKEEVRKRLVIERLLSTRVTTGISDPQAAAAAVNRWFQEVSGRASVRIALSEQLSAVDCSCCSSRGAAAAAARSGCCETGTGSDRNPAAGKASSAGSAKEAMKAGLSYWKKKHGAEGVTAQVQDFGCHFQVDILKENAVIASLRYQNGVVTEGR